MPKECSISRDFLRYLGGRENDNCRGTIQELALKICLLTTLIELNDGDIHQIHINSVPFSHWLTQSAILHSTPLPENLKIDFNLLKYFSYFYVDSFSPIQGELLFVHGGYAIRGQTQDAELRKRNYPINSFGPEDCSTWIKKLINCEEIFATVDLLSFYNYFFHRGPVFWENNQIKLALEEKLIPLDIESINEIFPGYLVVTRNFNLTLDPEKTLSLGKGGHVALILQINYKEKTFIIAEYGRQLPYIEGFGIRKESFDIANNKKRFFFKILDPVNICPRQFTFY